MDKAQALQNFWESFGIPAYEQTTVPESATMPYITYSVSTDSLDNVVNMYASIWYHSTSWKDISEKTEQIARYIVGMNPPSIKFDGGRLYIAKGTPFAQRMEDPNDDMIRRMYLNIQAEYLSAY
jgi:hypothetical protein